MKKFLRKYSDKILCRFLNLIFYFFLFIVRNKIFIEVTIINIYVSETNSKFRNSEKQLSKNLHSVCCKHSTSQTFRILVDEKNFILRFTVYMDLKWFSGDTVCQSSISRAHSRLQLTANSLAKESPSPKNTSILTSK